MQRYAALAVLVVVLSAGYAQAQSPYKWDMFWNRAKKDYARMNAYPEPFIHADRDAQREPFRRMVCKGWQLEHTLGAHYFNPDTNELTRNGEMKVRTILTSAPQHHRDVYVLKGYDANSTATRVDSVQRAVARIIPDGEMPAVHETGTELRGRPGEYVDDAYRKAYSSLPAPVLPAASGGDQ